MSRKSEIIEVDVGLSNEYKLTVHKSDGDGQPIPGSARDLTGWFHNLITDIGMDAYGVAIDGTTNATSEHWARGCRVGSGNATPSTTDTNLQSIVATTVTKESGPSHSRNLDATPKYVEKTTVYRFAEGVAAGNLTEVGLVPGVSDGTGTNGALNNSTPCSTRALILDGGGNPTTVTVLADEILDVNVRQRLYIPASDVTGTITPDGGVSGPIDYVIRPSDIDQQPTTNQGGWGGGSNETGWNFQRRQSGGYGENKMYVGSSSGIGSETDEPTGTAVSRGSGGISNLAYTPGDHYQDIKMDYPLGTANTGSNDPDGIGAWRICTGCCSFQIGFTPRIVKTSDMLIDITFRINWARYTP